MRLKRFLKSIKSLAIRKRSWLFSPREKKNLIPKQKLTAPQNIIYHSNFSFSMNENLHISNFKEKTTIKIQNRVLSPPSGIDIILNFYNSSENTVSQNNMI